MVKGVRGSKKGKARGKGNNKKLYLVRLMCGTPLEPMEFHFEYVYARNRREAEDIALELYDGYICESVQATEVKEEWKEDFERRSAERQREVARFISKYGREDEPLYEPDPDE